MRSKLSDLKSLYTTLGGESTDVLNANSEIAVLNGILALGSVDSCQFIPDAIKAIADNFALIDPSPAATLIEKTVTANGTYNATSDSANGYSQVNVAVPAPSTFSVNMTATPIDQSSASITTDKTFAQTLQALNNGENVSLTVTYNASENEVYVYENVCCGIAHSVTNPDSTYIYAVVEVIGGEVMNIIWLQDDNTAALGTSSDTQLVIGQ